MKSCRKPVSMSAASSFVRARDSDVNWYVESPQDFVPSVQFRSAKLTVAGTPSRVLLSRVATENLGAKSGYQTCCCVAFFSSVLILLLLTVLSACCLATTADRSLTVCELELQS